MSSPRRIGLPETLRMRHDVHFVDQLGRPGGEPVGRMVPIEDIEHGGGDPGTRKLVCFFGGTRRAGDRMAGANEKRD